MTWSLHHGDCLDPLAGLASLGDRSVDHVICDPPYEADAHTKGRRLLHSCGEVRAIESAPIAFDAITEPVRLNCAEQWARIARRWIIVFCQVEASIKWASVLEAAGASYVRTGLWIKPNAQPQLTGDRPGVGYEAMVIAHAARATGKMRWNGGGRPAVWTCGVSHGLTRPDHPTPKPLDLMLALVRDFTDHGETILDPFAGSGTTGVACIQAGRQFLGWERDAKYHAVATARLEAAREQPDLFPAKARRPKTVDLFAGKVEQ